MDSFLLEVPAGRLGEWLMSLVYRTRHTMSNKYANYFSGAAGNRTPVLTESLARVLGQSNPSCPSTKYKRTLFAGHFGFPLRMRARSCVT